MSIHDENMLSPNFYGNLPRASACQEVQDMNEELYRKILKGFPGGIHLDGPKLQNFHYFNIEASSLNMLEEGLRGLILLIGSTMS